MHTVTWYRHAVATKGWLIWLLGALSVGLITQAWSCSGRSGGDLAFCLEYDCEDCQIIFQYSQGLSREQCHACQGIACPFQADQAPAECALFPCVDGKIVVRLCSADNCDELGAICANPSSLGLTCQIDQGVGDYGEPQECKADTYCAKNDCSDCRILAQHSDASLNSCHECQGALCLDEQDPCGMYPCVKDERVIQLCGCDEDCTDIAPFCGWHASIHATCQEQDDL